MIVLTMFFLAGCASAHVVSARDAALEVSAALEARVGRAPEEVTCPDDLTAEAGSSMRCSLTDGGRTYGVTIRVTEVVDDVANFDIDVDEQPS